jgi:hypothetical protein
VPHRPAPVDPAKVVKIECLELPAHFAEDEGVYEVRWGHRPKDYEMHDIVTLKKAVLKLMPDRVDDILDRLQNFRMAYLNLATGEITS